MSVNGFRKILQNPDEYMTSFAQNYAHHHTLNLDGPSRIGLTTPKKEAI